MTGRTISHYEILEKLGEGGMGVVYKARDLRLGRMVALKFLSAEVVADPEAIARFELEARSISALNHPHIATIHAMEEDAGRRFLVLEYLPGGTLRSRLREYRARREFFPLPAAIGTAIEIAEGLAHAHRNGIVHRDIKPENVMFNAEGVLRITDFGLAHSNRSEDLTRTGRVIGTASYMAPEQAMRNETSPRSDLFAAGIVLHEMLAGARPFSGESHLATLHAIVYDPPAPLTSLRPDAPPQLESILLRLLDKDPDRRPQTGEALAADLRALDTGDSVSSQASSGVTKTIASLETVKPARGKPKLWMAAGAVLAVVVLVASFVAWFGLERIGAARPGAARSGMQLAILPFTARSGNADDTAFGSGLADIVATKLAAASTNVWIVPAGDLRRDRVTTPDEARRVFGVPQALTGVVDRPASGGLTVDLRLIDTVSGAVLRRRVAKSGGTDSGLQEELLKDATALLGIPAKKQTPDTKASNAYDYYVLGDGYLQRYDQAGNLDAAVKAFERAIQLDPSYALAYAGLSEAWWRRYRYSSDPRAMAQARDAAIQALSRDERLDAPRITLGSIAVSAGQLEEGIRQLKTVLGRDPVNAAACRELAGAYVKAGRLSDAEATYKRAIQYRPDFWLGYSELATFYNDHARYPEAEAQLKRALSLTPDNFVVFRNLGGVQMARGDWADAERSFRKAVEIRPTGSVYSNLGALYIYLGRYADAIPVLEQAVALSANEQYVHLIWGNLGDAYRWTPGHESDARRAFGKAIELGTARFEAVPDDATLLSQLAMYHSKLGEDREAAEQMGQALKMKPNDPAILYRSAIVWELAHKRAQSLAALRSAVHAGYSLSMVEREPDLAALRSDPGYRAIAAQAAAKSKETN